MAKKKGLANKKVEAPATKEKVQEEKSLAPLNGKNKENQKVTFKTGGSLPALNDDGPALG